jgi:hypothetical protein
MATPIELAQLMLYYANSEFDFSAILFKVNSFIFLCLIGKPILIR